jgi:HAE1 family hydrophobic/amphiphilic exporter-1
MQMKNGLFDELKRSPHSLAVLKALRIALFMIAGVSAASAQTNAIDVRALSLEECILTAMDHNFDIQIVRYEPRKALYTLSGSYGAYDPGFTVRGEHDYNLSPGGIDAQGRPFSGTETDTDRFSTDLTGLLPWGTVYDLGASISDQTGNRPGTLTSINSQTVITNTVYDNISGNASGYYLTTNLNTSTSPIRLPFETTSGTAGALTLRQPLLKNFWIDTTRYTIFVNKRELKKREADFRDQLMSTVTAVETAYFDLIYAQENVKVQQKALELANQSLSENKKRVEVGAMAPLDEKQAASLVAATRATLIGAEAGQETAQRVLKDLLSDDYTNGWSSVSIAPTDKLLAIPETFDLQESWRKGLAQGPRYQLLQRRLTVEENAQAIRLQRNQVFPQVDLIGNYGYSGTGKEFSGALDQIRRQDSPFWAFGAQLTVPLAQISARNNLKVAKAVKEQNTLVLKQSEQKTLIQIENDIANAQSNFQSVDATREARFYAEAALEAEQKKLESGKSTSFVVLDLQQKLTDARSKEIRALADYNIALAQLAFDEGSTLERRRVDLSWK